MSAPTGSGKTVIGELAVVHGDGAGPARRVHAPLKALSNQKFGDFQRQFGRERVGLLTGDTSINRDADVLLMTTEVFRNMLLQPESDNPLARVSAVVLDEFHYMNDPGRGTVWEESCILCPPTTRIIALSATMANADSIASWLTKIHGPTELIASSFRPVPLRYLFADNLGLEPLFVAGDAGPGGRPDEPQSPKKRRQKWKLNPRLRPEQRLMREAEAAARARARRAAAAATAAAAGVGRGGRGRGAPADLGVDGGWGGGRGGGRGGGGGGGGGRGGFSGSERRGARGGALDAVPHPRAGAAEDAAGDRLHLLARGLRPGGAIRCLRPARAAARRLRGGEASRSADRRLPRGAPSTTDERGAALAPQRWRRGAPRRDAPAREGAGRGALPGRPPQGGVCDRDARRWDQHARALHGDHDDVKARRFGRRAARRRPLYCQMAGRAGRRGKDDIGHVVLCRSSVDGADVAHQLLLRPPDAIASHFFVSYGGAIRMLARARPTSASSS